eukprot:CAMPEP_0181300912 /NCGR_PEP_ID=MMETSP1101-20121128/7144_1 /TAXON_ID=46948 /ORGANISM="Rhodomonas abbreviata, Strain Caron Lab Isolate" /LENGTH=144 /DNA_ID=CAMNT_0023406183 /DNA_START=72 /DNA_END=506 /DNA_ORIENTATION=-
MTSKAAGVSFSRILPYASKSHRSHNGALPRRTMSTHPNVYVPEASLLLKHAKTFRDDGILEDSALLRAQECNDRVVFFRDDGEACVDQAKIEELRQIVKCARERKAAHASEVADHHPHPIEEAHVLEDVVMATGPRNPSQCKIS